MRKIVILGAFRFPNGDAAAARVLGIGKALRAAGFDVEFAGWEMAERQEDLQSDGSFNYQGFKYVSQSEIDKCYKSLFGRVFGFLLAGKNTIKWIIKQNFKPGTVIISYHGGSIFLVCLGVICSLLKFSFVFDCTEWYESKNLPGGRYGLVAFDSFFRMKFIYPLIGRGIVISSYLERYYKNTGGDVLMVPPLVDFDEEKWSFDLYDLPDCSTIKLVYAGSPGKKDFLGNVIRGIDVLLARGVGVELHLVGPTKEVLFDCLGDDSYLLDKLQNNIFIHGRVPQIEVPRLLAMSDFSVLLRPVARYSEAGFSTKLVESMAIGVPVIANPTGDILKYVVDFETGIVVRDESVDGFVDGVCRINALSFNDRVSIKRNAKKMALQVFDYKNYSNSIKDFLDRN